MIIINLHKIKLVSKYSSVIIHVYKAYVLFICLFNNIIYIYSGSIEKIIGRHNRYKIRYKAHELEVLVGSCT